MLGLKQVVHTGQLVHYNRFFTSLQAFVERTNVGIGSQGLVMFGTDEQKAKYLPGIASGEIITSFALTEAEAGSDSANVQTRAVLDGDAYVLNGAKRYITNANKAHLFTVMARSNPRFA